MSLILPIVLGMLFGISSSLMGMNFLKKRINEVSNYSLKRKLLILIQSSLFISIPVCILISIIMYKTQSRYLTGISIMIYGLFGLIFMVVMQSKEGHLKEKFNRQLVGVFMLYFVYVYLGLKIVLEANLLNK